ncbi:hypothetical protein D3C81_1951920 [compost metagenome]
MFICHVGQGAWTILPDPIHQLLGNRVVGGAWLVIFDPFAVIDQTGGEQIGLAVVEVVKKLADVLAHGDF